MAFKLNINAPAANFDQLTRIKRAVENGERIINSEEFKAWFMGFQFSQLEESDDTDGKTNEQLYKQLLVQVDVKYHIERRPWYKRWSTVVGWEDDDGVHTYSDCFDEMGDGDLANHLAHEGTHAAPINFSHSFNPTFDRDQSLPYAIGAAVGSRVK